MVCNQRVGLDFFLKIMHGFNLILTNITCNIPKQPNRSAIIGRHVLESIGCTNRLILNATCSQHNEKLDVAKTADNKNSHTNLASLLGVLFGVSLLYDTGLNEKKGLEEIDMHMDFGNDSKGDNEK